MRFFTLPRTLLRRSWMLPFAALLTWANWDAPDMHHFVQPAETAIWQLAPLGSAADAESLRVQLAAQPGVSACAVSPRTNCVALVYHPEAVTVEALYRAVSQAGAKVITDPPVSAAPAVRQCPVPPGAFVVVDQIRFALNVRRFFTNV